MPLNAKFKEKIDNAKNNDELEQIFNEIKQRAFIDYRVDIKRLNDDEFKKLSFDKQKEILRKILDTNMDYVLYSDIEDCSLDIDEFIKKINDKFQRKIWH